MLSRSKLFDVRLGNYLKPLWYSYSADVLTWTHSALKPQGAKGPSKESLQGLLRIFLLKIAGLHVVLVFGSLDVHCLSVINLYVNIAQFSNAVQDASSCLAPPPCAILCSGFSVCQSRSLLHWTEKTEVRMFFNWSLYFFVHGPPLHQVGQYRGRTCKTWTETSCQIVRTRI